ncbi:TIM-barrel domain-containing protein [Caldicellulosiruptoraceae bacterium PP1]
MKIDIQNNQTIIKAEKYKLIFTFNHPLVKLEVDGQDAVEFFPFSQVNALDGIDDTTAIGIWEVEEEDKKIIVKNRCKSSIWDEKIYKFICTNENIHYQIEIKGNNRITDIKYFGGNMSAIVRWGSGFFYSKQDFEKLFNPEPNSHEQNIFEPSIFTKIDIMGVPLPAKGDWFFTPPPFCYSFKLKDKESYLSFGLEAKPFENLYNYFNYVGTTQAFYLETSLEGYKDVEGFYTLPQIGIYFGNGFYNTIEKHSQYLCDYVYEIKKKSDIYEWWKNPIYCGWGSQCYKAKILNKNAPELSRQELYEEFLNTLESRELNPGIVVIDDKWQKQYGLNDVDTEKWPDMKGFIQKRHEKGQKVLLWLKAWDTEGLDSELCITNKVGVKVAFDVTNPKFETMLRNQIRYMLSTDGLDADGFKIDFTARIPAGPGLLKYSWQWGLELQKKYLEILYTEAKKAKNDALIMAHTPHPYLSEYIDMIRLNDINVGKDILSAMKHRFMIAKIACPDVLIDTDNWPITDKKTLLEYIKLQPELGVPSLYYATHVDSTGEELDISDYLMIRSIWNSYCQKIK